VRAVEDALGIQIPPNARLIRNIMEGIQYIQDHVIHFYHLAALDWVDIVSALDADPAKTAALAQSISDWPLSSATHFAGVKDRLATFAASGQLGIFANAYWGHPAYKLPPEANLMAVAHYLEALDWQKDVIRIHAVFGSKNPHPQTYLVGGMACPVGLDSQNAINATQLAMVRKLFAKARDFVERVHVPDLLAIASFYKDWAAIGGGLGNYLAYGDFPMTDSVSSDEPGDLFFPRGLILGNDLSTVYPVDQQKIAECVTHSWFEYGDNNASLHPWDGETNPNYTGPQPPYEWLETDQKYSWIKAPRYDNTPVEVGPLARMLIAYAQGHERVQHWVNAALGTLEVGPEALFSTLGRIAARGLETVVLAEKVTDWLDELEANLGQGDLRIANTENWDPSTWPDEAVGWGWTEAPRGALGHWVRIKDGGINNYQCIVPSTWNASPRDSTGVRGAYESALQGTPVADPEQPLEILRVVHSFDPCMACAVHVTDPDQNEIVRVQAK
jgi:Ni,Fe-hydrogenase I large subunit